VPSACVTRPATASPCRFSMTAWPISCCIAGSCACRPMTPRGMPQPSSASGGSAVRIWHVALPRPWLSLFAVDTKAEADIKSSAAQSRVSPSHLLRSSRCSRTSTSRWTAH
jgi:hypothetical protein